jgi:O-acetyl-ADP-ribose deacetylase
MADGAPPTALRVWMGDITRLEVDAIVNAANSSLMGGGGVDGSIHREGGPSIRAECQRIVAEHGPLNVGEAVVTGAGRLPASHVIHTVGPIWHEVSPEEGGRLLASCYRSCLDVARASGVATIAFPAISTGAYGFPVGLAASTALKTVKGWIADQHGALAEVTFVCYDSTNFYLYRAGVAL